VGSPGGERQVPKFLASIDFGSLNRRLWRLLMVFVLLNFADVAITLLALRSGHFVELNPLASQLFSRRMPGFLLALLLKYMPLAPMLYACSLDPEHDGQQRQVRAIKLGTFAALFAANSYLMGLLAFNAYNLLSLQFS